MASLNECKFIGRLGKDPELQYIPNGDAVVKFSMAVSEKWKDKSGQKHERTEWIPVTAWRKLAEIIGEYCRKGDLIYISGKFQSRDYEDKEGIKRYTTEIVASQMLMLGSNKGEGNKAKDSYSATAGSYPTGKDDNIPF